MSTAVDVADWIKRTADDERQRDAVRSREREILTRKARLIELNGRRLVDELCAAVTRDVEAFGQEFPGDSARNFVLELAEPRGGFVVRKSGPPAASLTVDLHLETGAVSCHYQFMSESDFPPREQRFELLFVGTGAETLQIKQAKTGRVFETTDALSEFLLVPVLTGRPR